MNGNIIEIHNGTSFVRIPKIIDYEVQYCKLWSSDTGRSMTGENRGTLIGIFPKIVLKIGKLTENEMSALLSIFNKSRARVRYYDTEYKRYVEDEFYFGDAQDQLNKQKDMSHKPISISIIAIRRRGG